VAVNQDQIKRAWPELTDAGRRLADLTAMGVDIQVVAPMPMHRYWAEPDLAIKLATVTNEAVAAHRAAGLGRLVGLGAMGELGLAGVSVSTKVDGRELADRAFDPVWGAAADLGAVLMIHPLSCSLGPRLNTSYLGSTFGHLVEAVSSDTVVLGTDYPFDIGVTDPVERATAAGLPAADLTASLSGNATRPLQRPAA
jgi:aminocarboxymuconate-semialdehyde decarboxylase